MIRQEHWPKKRISSDQTGLLLSWHARLAIYRAVAVVFLLVFVSSATASDPEGCLICHRYRGLGRLSSDGQTIRPYYVDPSYYDRALGPHARLRCTDCHKRSEVEIVPHQPVSRVDCTQSCHLAEAERIEVQFGHDRISQMLQGSVHNEKVLDESNELLGHPLDEHQSRCLLCHDEPVFHQDAESLGEQKAPIERCNVCHDHRLSVDTRYYYWHVFARSRPARKHANLVRVCAVCHSNPSILNKFEMPNSIASYLASFHGKAMELGSEETAVCLDCHIGPLQNIHVMQSPAQTDSPTNSKHLADTCRSPECHPSAGKRMSSAAVHLNISTSRGIEYLVACLFVLLIIFTFGPSLLLTSLEILQVVIGRTDPGHHKRLRLAERLLMFPEGRVRLERFNLHHRIQHWVLVACFATLVATGFPIKFADRAWAGWMISHLGGLPVTRFMHRWMGMLLILGFVYHLGYTTLVIRKRIKASGKTIIQTILALPMVMRREDLRQMKHLLGYLFFIRRDRPKAGRFSLEEKFEYFGVFWGAVLLGATGLLMWHSNWTTRYLTGRILTLAALVHTFEAFLALLHVGIVHMVTVIFAPSVFPVSPAMFTGTTPPEELAEGHAAMIEEAAQELQIDIDHNEIESGNEKANNDKADKEVDHD